MSYEPNILEIPVDKAKNADDLVKWFESNKIYQKKHPALSLPVKNEFPAMIIISVIVMIGTALLILEQKGKLKVKKSVAKSTTPDDFLSLITKSKTEKNIEELIEARYDLDLIVNTSHYGSVVSEPETKYTLDDVFGIWKNKKNTLDKVREEQWGKRK